MLSTRTSSLSYMIPLMTVDHHRQGVGLRHPPLEIECRLHPPPGTSVATSRLQKSPAYRHPNRPRHQPVTCLLMVLLLLLPTVNWSGPLGSDSFRRPICPACGAVPLQSGWGSGTRTPVARFHAEQTSTIVVCFPVGAVNLTKAGRSWTSELSGSSSSGHGPPRVHRVTAELAHCLASDQMTLDIEGVVDGGVGGEKPLRRS